MKLRIVLKEDGYWLELEGNLRGMICLPYPKGPIGLELLKEAAGASSTEEAALSAKDRELAEAHRLLAQALIVGILPGRFSDEVASFLSAHPEAKA